MKINQLLRFEESLTNYNLFQLKRFRVNNTDSSHQFTYVNISISEKIRDTRQQVDFKYSYFWVALSFNNSILSECANIFHGIHNTAVKIVTTPFFSTHLRTAIRECVKTDTAAQQDTVDLCYFFTVICNLFYCCCGVVCDAHLKRAPFFALCGTDQPVVLVVGASQYRASITVAVVYTTQIISEIWWQSEFCLNFLLCCSDFYLLFSSTRCRCRCYLLSVPLSSSDLSSTVISCLMDQPSFLWINC